MVAYINSCLLNYVVINAVEKKKTENKIIICFHVYFGAFP